MVFSIEATQKGESVIKHKIKKKRATFKIPWIRRFLFLIPAFLITFIPISPALSLQEFKNKFVNNQKDLVATSQPKETQKKLKLKPVYSIPLDHFFINLPQDRGQKLFKLEMKLSVDNPGIQNEINKRMLQIRDMIIILVSSKKYEQISTRQGQENLKEEIRDTINSFLTKGRINQVLFTEFIET